MGNLSLVYAVITTRPDITLATVVSKCCANPTQSHLTAAKRILRYLKGAVYLDKNFGFIKRVDKGEKIWKADVSSVSPSSERIEELLSLIHI